MPSDFWFMSYNYNTGKVLYINTLDVIDIFYDSARPTGIISSTSMLACGQIGIKKNVSLRTKGARFSCRASTSLRVSLRVDSFRHTWSSPANTISREIKPKWARKEKLSLLSFFLGSLPSFLSAWNFFLCGNLQSWPKLILNSTEVYLLFLPHTSSSPLSLSLSLLV